MCANVDLYSGFVYKCMNIPEELYTPMFAISRVAGWCAHRIEELMYGGKLSALPTKVFVAQVRIHRSMNVNNV